MDNIKLHNFMIINTIIHNPNNFTEIYVIGNNYNNKPLLEIIDLNTHNIKSHYLNDFNVIYTATINPNNSSQIYIAGTDFNNNSFLKIIDLNTHRPILQKFNRPIPQFTINEPNVGCFTADSKIFCQNNKYIPIQLLKKGDLVQTLNDGLLPVKFVGKRSFFNKLTEERINPHLYKLNKKDFPELLEDLFITGGHPLLVDDKDLDEETKKKLLDMVDYGTPIITEGKYRVFAMIHPKAELWNEEGNYEIFDIVLENNDLNKNYGIWVNGILTESMDEYFFLNESGMTELI